MSEVLIGVGQTGFSGQGPHMIIVLRTMHSQIIDARFSTYGCPAAHACGQYVCDEIEDKTTEYAASIDEATILRSIGQMPLGREHCPSLAVSALKSALNQIKEASNTEAGNAMEGG